MKPFQDQPIAHKALILGTAPTVVAVCLVVAASMVATYFQARTNMERDLDAEAELVAENVGAALAFNDRKTAADTVKTFRTKTSIETVCLFDVDRKLFASFARSANGCPSVDTAESDSGVLVSERPVMMGDRRVGVVRVTGNFSRLYVWTRRQSLVAIAMMAVGLFLSLALTRRLARDITDPLQNLAITADRVSSTRDYSIRAAVMSDDEVGSVVASFNGMLGQIQEQHDVTARALEREREASRLKDQFLAALSHELRTPLNAMLGWLQIIRTTKPGAQTVQRALDSLERNAKAQARLIEDLIDVSRALTGKLQLKTEIVDLRTVVKSALDVAEVAARAKDVHISGVMPETACFVSGDPDRLQQIMWNVFSNAVKFTPGGGTVTVDLRPSKRDFALTVTDTGVGISREFLPYVFDRFRQADGSMTREHGGLGIGLSIVKELTELHGGSVAVSSPGMGLGTTFIVRIPGAMNIESQPRDAVAAAPPPESVLEGVRVLVVDDDADAAEMLAEGLRAAGATVQTAASGDEAVDVWSGDRFEVLVCDLAMPRLDGFAVLKTLRLRPQNRGREPFAIAVSAHTLPEDRQRSLAAGFNMHLAKPVDLTALTDAIVAGRDGWAQARSVSTPSPINPDSTR